MNRPRLRGLRALLVSLFAFSFAGCSSLSGGALPAGLTDVLGQVTGLSSGIADWQSGLTGMLDNAGLGQLKEYAAQAGDLGNSISGLQDGLSSAMADPLGAIGGKLTDMSGIDVDSLKSLAPSAQMDAVKDFSDSAGGVGDMVTDFMSKFGN